MRTVSSVGASAIAAARKKHDAEAAKDAVIATKDTEITTLNTTVSDLNATVATKDTEIASLDTTIAQLKAQYEGQLNSGLNPNPLLSLNPWLPRTNAGASSAIKAFFNYDEDRIELDPIEFVLPR